MLQQTQVSTVIPYFHRFIERFPTIAHLAAADEQEVLRLWQGLGYYSRARNLQKAARQIMEEHEGKVPTDLESLRSLPGVGRYTAGAVASIAFEQPAPILDGNVMRVLCRLDRIKASPREPSTQEVLWARAAELLPKNRIGDFNSALMELGALVCTPRAPACLICPVRVQCEAFACGEQEKIPPPRIAKPTPLVKRWTFCIRRGNRWLIEQRPPHGRWAGMWQFVTIEAGTGKPTPRRLAAKMPVDVSTLKRLDTVRHALTHRKYNFEVYTCESRAKAASKADNFGRWVTLAELADYPLPQPHVKIAEMLDGRRFLADIKIEGF